MVGAGETRVTVPGHGRHGRIHLTDGEDLGVHGVEVGTGNRHWVRRGMHVDISQAEFALYRPLGQSYRLRPSMRNDADGPGKQPLRVTTTSSLNPQPTIL